MKCVLCLITSWKFRNYISYVSCFFAVLFTTLQMYKKRINLLYEMLSLRITNLNLYLEHNLYLNFTTQVHKTLFYLECKVELFIMPIYVPHSFSRSRFLLLPHSLSHSPFLWLAACILVVSSSPLFSNACFLI